MLVSCVRPGACTCVSSRQYRQVYHNLSLFVCLCVGICIILRIVSRRTHTRTQIRRAEATAGVRVCVCILSHVHNIRNSCKRGERDFDENERKPLVIQAIFFRLWSIRLVIISVLGLETTKNIVRNLFISAAFSPASLARARVYIRTKSYSCRMQQRNSQNSKSAVKGRSQFSSRIYFISFNR